MHSVSNLMKRLLIIPARLGSRRIKDKNIKLFYGKPIIYYSINIAKKSKLFNTIHVSTESPKIKKIVEKFGLKIDFLRDKKLSNNFVGLIDVFRFVVKKYKVLNKKFDEVWFLSTCAPLLETKDLKKAAKKFYRGKINSLLAVGKYSPPIEWAMKIDKKKKLKPVFNKKINIRSQDLKNYYFDSGLFGIFKTSEIFKKHRSFSPFVLEKYKAIDIDNLDDWQLLQKIYG